MEYLFETACLCSPFLVIASISLTNRSEAFPKIFLAHLLIFTAYFVVTGEFHHQIFGPNELKGDVWEARIQLFGLHSLLGFVHALYVKRQMWKAEEALNSDSENEL